MDMYYLVDFGIKFIFDSILVVLDGWIIVVFFCLVCFEINGINNTLILKFNLHLD